MDCLNSLAAVYVDGVRVGDLRFPGGELDLSAARLLGALGAPYRLVDAENANVVFSQLAPWQFDLTKQMNLKRTFRRVAFLTTRLTANLGVPSSTPLLSRFSAPVDAAGTEKRWLDGLYLDTPEEWDDPYRFFGW